MNAGKREFSFFLAFAIVLHAAALLVVRVPKFVAPAPTAILFRFDELARRPAAPAKQASAPRPVAAAKASPSPQPRALPASEAKAPTLPPATKMAPPKSKAPAPAYAPAPDTTTKPADRPHRPEEASSRQTASVSSPASAPAAAAPADRAAAQSESRLAVANYEQVLAAWLDRHKYYPAPLRRRGLQGSGEIRIRIDRDGTVLYAAMNRHLPHSMLDEAALDWAERADPFPAVPESIPGSSYEFIAPVEFAIR